jgi:hypothetical protein
VSVFTVFLVATVLVFALSAYCAHKDFRQHGDTLSAAALLMAVLQLSIMCRSTDSGPMGLGETALLALVDLAAVLLVFLMWRTHKAWWKFALLVTFVCDLMAHYAAWRGWYDGHDTRYWYIVSLNALAVVQLLIVGWPGAGYVARLLNARMSGPRSGHAWVRHGAVR